MTDTDTKTRPTFLGIDIEGDIDRSDRKEQRPLEELQPIVQAVLADPTVVEFGWRQYTPYFNDGDPCVFQAYGAWVRLDTDPGNAEDDEPDRLEIYSHAGLGKRPYAWADGQRLAKAYEGPDEARYDRLLALDHAVSGGHFCDVLLDLFGDHARVTVRRTGIQVDSYSHD